jgi:hypothetical protein
MKQALRASIVLLFAAFSFGCGSDNPVQPGNVAGIYYSSQFVTTGTGGQTNQLLAGSYVNIQLLPNGSTIGQLHLVASSSNPALDADLAGSWSQSGNTVTFTQSADTFIRNMTFTVVPSGTSWELVGDHVFAGTRVQLTLSQGGII